MINSKRIWSLNKAKVHMKKQTKFRETQNKNNKRKIRLKTLMSLKIENQGRKFRTLMKIMKK